MLGGYYRFYPGDYLRDTSGLSLIEHGAYNLLLHNYYSTEGCLAGEKPRLYRLCGATSTEEQRAVDYVISKFFPIIQGKLTNKRADKEIDGRRQYLEEQSRKGKLGGRPKKKPNESRGKAGEKPKPKPGESLPAPAPVPGPGSGPTPEKKASDLSVSVVLTDGANGEGALFDAAPPPAPSLEELKAQATLLREREARGIPLSGRKAI